MQEVKAQDRTFLKVMVSTEFVPEEGDAFDAVMAALELAEIPASVVQVPLVATTVKVFHDDESMQTWAVRIVFRGELYGREDCLSHDKGDPLVEFFDTRYEHTYLGQFVSRYYMSTLLEGNQGLCLDGGVPSWGVNRQCMKRIRDWVATFSEGRSS